MQYSQKLARHETGIPGLVLFDLPVHGDNRGWFKENWQREKMRSIGLPDFGPVQNNVSFNESRGTTRGIHAEPWDKYVSVATGSVFGAWVDLRDGDTFGQVFTAVLDPSKAIFVPRGVGNSFQTLEDGTAYSYLVNDHWSEQAQHLYTFLNLADPTVNIAWPVSLDDADLSDKDRSHPFLSDVIPMKPKRTLLLGTNGQLGRAIQQLVSTRGEDSDWQFANRSQVDLAAPETLDALDWSQIETVVNAAAYTKVDDAETESGRRDAWAVNGSGVSHLAALCTENRVRLVHVSTDYVFDGQLAEHSETEPLSPLGVYGQSKAAGELAAQQTPQHYVLRTSWVVGDGNNFVATMRSLAGKGVSPTVVNDQYGRLTFAEDLAGAILHLLSTHAPFGTYNVSNTGEVVSWFEIAKRVYATAGRDEANVSPVSTAEFFKDKAHAPRPEHSAFNLEKLLSTGFTPRNQWDALAAYLRTLA